MDKPFPRVDGLLNVSVLDRKQLEDSLLNFLGYIDSPVGRKAYPKLIECVDYVRDQVEQAMEKIESSEDACPGCSCRPGDGITESCDDAAGCGHFKSLRDQSHAP